MSHCLKAPRLKIRTQKFCCCASLALFCRIAKLSCPHGSRLHPQTMLLSVLLSLYSHPRLSSLPRKVKTLFCTEHSLPYLVLKYWGGKNVTIIWQIDMYNIKDKDKHWWVTSIYSFKIKWNFPKIKAEKNRIEIRYNLKVRGWMSLSGNSKVTLENFSKVFFFWETM